MAGIKIINVLKDDTLDEILDLFRQVSTDEVVFVLPRNAKIFRKEDHFAMFAAEAASSGKTISILSPNHEINTLARKYKFAVMSASKPERAPAKTSGGKSKKATLVSKQLPTDTDIQDPNEDAFDSDVVIPGGEQDEIKNSTEEDSDAEALQGFGVVEDANEKSREPASGSQPPTPDLDYVDAMWRAKAAEQQPEPQVVVARPEQSAWAKMTRPALQQNSKKRGGFSKTVAAGILVASVVVLGFAVYLTTGSATIAVSPTSRPIDERITIHASDLYSSIDSAFGKIPGQLISITKSVSRQEQATGQRDIASKARGSITVYNAFSSAPQSLVATTRFVNSAGIVFRTLQNVTVPGSTVKGGTMVPGSVTVDAIADRSGPTYNIPAGRFTIAAFQEKGDTVRAEKIYGISTAAMTGGASGPSKVVTAADIAKAQKGALDDAQQQIADALKSQSDGMQVLDIIQPTIGTPTLSAKPDDAVASVSASVTATLKTIALRTADLQQLIRDSVMKNDRLVVFPDKLKLTFSDPVFDSATSTMTFIVALSGTGYSPVDVSSITSEVKGKDGQQIRDYFSNRDGITTATIRLSPFWVRHVPSTDSRVHIEVQYKD